MLNSLIWASALFILLLAFNVSMHLSMLLATLFFLCGTLRFRASYIKKKTLKVSWEFISLQEKQEHMAELVRDVTRILPLTLPRFVVGHRFNRFLF